MTTYLFGAGALPSAQDLSLVLDPPRCKVTASSTASINTGTTTLISWDGEQYDTATMHDNSSNPSRIYASIAGTYRVRVITAWAAATNTNQILVRKNAAGSPSGGTTFGWQNHGNSAAVMTHWSDEIVLAASDYIEAFRYHGYGSGLAPSDQSGAYIAPAWLTMRLVAVA